ncbi:MAG: UDP-N-acetylmuramate--L-alanine ligase [Chlamydiae bacterium GWC2_50_10]|nr:MAG: UDP-N-acetylmuramate--L-alanine ligase [Chlamydiae bacterium GWA2_50_15]OGN54902.1 MAG: UDP-N-acetylmuramate--L-alanine ligase [Chlamydiae bacterium GWC2_50_10]OGN58569.1 MAG: UDP-N-acetylmuramate--L-alanine ligase [Chlamydiae bacterium RIFCSPHIGHO2_02_FULL_49_29]OGN62774.1 MAG: UDP-N-acetylmuramate--L-alanine ligase [Chlamydiae bacterium RIFCSPHIGHO2_12_FULL_49_32]OGN70295.1 MAG: UDP-N-acetylmuramate--L-alanine ligase [Chlamydiae bacterium RIFCSPLOWO2_02_FULL_49_12]OGN71499.1 MAG: UDP
MIEQAYHLIGIGGIGMSALAFILAERKERVTGSDIKESSTTLLLRQKGIKLFLGHSEKNLPEGKAIIVYSSAVLPDNPEYRAALLLGLPLIHRSELLRRLMEGKEPLLVTGTHGKTTTTALLAHVLTVAGLNPSYAIGGMVPSLQGNGKEGKGSYFVAEADESDGSFLKLNPYGAIVTNLEEDHMDYWKSEKKLIEGFKKFIEKVRSGDLLLWGHDDRRLFSLHPGGASFGFSKGASLSVLNFQQAGWKLLFDFTFEKREFNEVALPLIGAHNVLNAAAVFGLCLRLHLSEEKIREAFLSFQGVARRAEKKGEFRGSFIYDDYAHHPTEIYATLRAVKSTLPQGRLIAAFQPHRYTRSLSCLHQFPEAFYPADCVILTDIYAAGEAPIEGISSEQFYRTLKENCPQRVEYVPRLRLSAFLSDFLEEGDLLITLGAGDITAVGPELIQLEERCR